MSGGEKSSFQGMSGRVPKNEEVVMRTRRTLAETLKFYMSRAPEDLQTSKGLEKASGVSYKTIDRMLYPDTYHTGSNTDNVALVAHALKLEPWELLRPASRQPLVRGVERPLSEKPADSAKQTKGLRDKKPGKS